ncbi:MAG: S-layer homology domain-containing protein [Syntrophomonadaceae bacterium]
MKKSFLSFVVMIAFLVSMVCTQPMSATADAVSFTDVKGHWAITYINNLTNLGYLKGYPDKTFKPDNNMTRAEFTTALINCAEISLPATGNSFADTGSHWGKKYIEAAVKNGILEVDEYPQGLFKPDSTIKRSEAAAMLVRALGKAPDEGKLVFTDADQVERSMYRDHIKTAYDIGLISGFPDGTFLPFRDMTRAQVCTVLTKFLEQYDGTAPTSPVVTPASGSLKTITIGDKSYTLGQDAITIKYGFSDIKVASMSVINDALQVNGSYGFALNSTANNPDIVAGNTRYVVSKMIASGDKLIISSDVYKINTFDVGTYRYNSDFIKLYINSSNKENYLSDMEILDETTVRINKQTYDLSKDKITIDVQDTFYDITKITFTADDILPQLSKTVPVVFRGLYLTDISAIFVGTETLNLSKITRIDFIIDGKRYRSSEITIDASANFTINRQVFPADKVKMVIDEFYYDISHIQALQDKFVFYLQESTADDYIIFNGVYRDYEDIKIIVDSVVYDMDRVFVVNRNILRIGGKQYGLDDTIKCRVDGKLWDITRIEWDSTKEMTTIKATESKSGTLLNQPSKYLFFDDRSRKIKDGADDTVTIYANRKWITFDQLLITDPTTFSYNGANYELIGSSVRIDRDEYEIYDTSWQGRDQIMNIYLQ